MQLWIERPELRERVGRVWVRKHFQTHHPDALGDSLGEKLEILDRLVSERQRTHLILGGKPDAVARVRSQLPKRVVDKIIDGHPAASTSTAADVICGALSSFADHEQGVAGETVGLLLAELRQGGLAVSGTQAVLQALVAGQADLLVLAEEYRPAPGWSCNSCADCGLSPVPTACPSCGERDTHAADLRELMVQLAGRSGSRIEIVRKCDALIDLDEVGCLLRYLTPEQHKVRA